MEATPPDRQCQLRRPSQYSMCLLRRDSAYQSLSIWIFAGKLETEKSTNVTTATSRGATVAATADVQTPPIAADQPPPVRRVHATKTQREKRSLRMFIAVLMLMTTFLVCRLPTWVFLLYKLYFNATTNLQWMLHYAFGLLSIVNCILNPLFYTFLSETIRCSFGCASFLQKCWKAPYSIWCVSPLFHSRFRICKLCSILLSLFGYQWNEFANFVDSIEI